jgi:acyl-CoA synthetase (NDP forming)
MAHRLDPLLQPRSIALIGASGNPARIGGMPLDLLRHFGYAGEVYPINPKYDEVFGWRCRPDIESLPAAPDLVVLAVAAQDVTAMLRRAHAKGVKAAIVYAAGFAEAGDAGKALQEELEAFVAASGMVLAGPNCMGFANLNLHVYTAFATIFKTVAPQQRPGRVSLVTQSGNVCSAVFGLLRQLDIAVSHFINTGNEATLEFAQYLDFLAQDSATDCVVGYIEQLRDGPAFIDAALACAAQDKPLILYKAGETEKGSEAVRSHTSALAGNLALYKAAFRQLNVIPGNDFAQMADVAMLSAYRRRKAGKRVAIVTLSGALGAILADKFIAAGLEVPTLAQELQDTLRAGIPDYGMVSNPIDCTGNIVNDASFVSNVATALATSDAVDTVVIYAMGGLLDKMAEPLLEVCRRHAKLFVVIDTGNATKRAELAAGGIPVFTDLGRAVQAIAPFCWWHERQAVARRWAGLRSEAATTRVERRLTRLNEYETKQLLAEFGVPAVHEIAAADADAAVAAAHRLGYPVARKILSADVAHKTEAGGVRLGLADDMQVRRAFDDVLTSVQAHAPGARIDGVLMQPMSKGVAELIAGITHDPVFGAALTVGLGGVLTELYGDVSHRLLPVDAQGVDEMLRELKAFPLMDGFRGRPKADIEAATRAIAALAEASQALGPAAQEIEVNPLQVRPRGEGAVALDALLLAAIEQGA